jgi:ABC-2 type transport system permease protein
LFYGFESLAGLSPTGPGIEFLQNLGMKAHFESIARGVLDSRDIIYFIGLCLFFLFLAADRLKNQRQ